MCAHLLPSAVLDNLFFAWDETMKVSSLTKLLCYHLRRLIFRCHKIKAKQLVHISYS
jgi:hypothetical protein